MTRRERERCRRLMPCEGYSSRCAEAAYCERESMAEDDERDRRKDEEARR